jgi:hypothetical protein
LFKFSVEAAELDPEQEAKLERERKRPVADVLTSGF